MLIKLWKYFGDIKLRQVQARINTANRRSDRQLVLWKKNWN